MLMAFLVIWSTPWLLGSFGLLPTNPGRGSGQVHTALPIFFLVFPVALFIIGLFLCLRALSDRVELEGTRLKWFDWVGRCRGSAELTEVNWVDDVDVFVPVSDVRTVVRAGERAFAFGKVGTRGYFELRARLIAARHGQIFGSGDLIKPVRDPVCLTPRVYRYRWSGLHGMGLFLGLFAVFGIYSGLQAFGLLLGVTLWLHLLCWNERVEVRESEIVWFDWRNRARKVLPVEEIFGVGGMHSGGGAYHIDGSRGVICFSQYLNGADDLIKQIERMPSYSAVREGDPGEADVLR